MSLEALSDRARVSRSMLSAIERGLKSPTVLVLDRIATGLDTSLARLLGTETRARLIVMQRRDQKVARDTRIHVMTAVEQAWGERLGSVD